MSSDEARTHRKRLGLSQVKFARTAGVSRYRYIMFELGNGDLTAEERRLVKEVFDRLARAQIEVLTAIRG